MKRWWGIVIAGMVSYSVQAQEVNAELIKLNCLICHQSSVLKWKSQTPAHILQQLKAIKTGQKHTLIMQRIVTGLTDQELSDVSQLIGQQHGAQ